MARHRTGLSDHFHDTHRLVHDSPGINGDRTGPEHNFDVSIAIDLLDFLACFRGRAAVHSAFV